MSDSCTAPFSVWEPLVRQVVWARRVRVEDAYRDRIHKPAGMRAAWRVIEGSLRVEADGKRIRAVAGNWFFPGRSEVRRVFSKGAEILSLRFRLTWQNGTEPLDQSVPVLTKGEVRPLDEAALALVDLASAKSKNLGGMFSHLEVGLEEFFLLERCVLRWFEAYVSLMTAMGNPPRIRPMLDPRIASVIRAMNAGLRSGILRTERELAQECGLSLSQLKRLFARDVGKSPKEWMDDRRMEIAHARLGGSRDPIKRIAYEMGFRSPNHFSSWFRKKEGQTASQFRREAITAIETDL
jgi:AraC-like DNA-binding protein